MGRISRLYPKGRLRLRIPKMVQSGKKYPLYIEYNWHADSIRKSTGISVSERNGMRKAIAVLVKYVPRLILTISIIIMLFISVSKT